MQAMGRIPGNKAKPADLGLMKLSAKHKFKEHEIVLVARSRGGFTYGEIWKKTNKTVCHTDNKTEHVDPRYRVLYGGSFKDCAADTIGKLALNAPPSDKRPTDKGERTVGAPVLIKDLDVVSFSSGNIFRQDDLVVVPRSGGGFSYGRIMSPAEVQCQTRASTAHPVAGWRIQVSAEAAACLVWKELAVGAIGKVYGLEAGKVYGVEAKAEKAVPLKVNSNRKAPLEEENSDTSRSTTSSLEDIQWRGDEFSDEDSSHGSPLPRTGSHIDSRQGRKTPQDRTRASPSGSPKSPKHHSEKPVIKEVRHNYDEEEPKATPRKLEGSGGLLALNSAAMAKIRQNVASLEKEKPSGQLIVVDGPNVAMKHSNHQSWSMRGLQICLQYYKDRGHNVVAFLPESYLKRQDASLGRSVKVSDFTPVATDIPLLQRMVEKGEVALTPAQDYDDSYTIQYAKSHNGCIVTNDRYWDHIDKFQGPEKEKVKKWIRDHSISFTFVLDDFLPNPDFKWP